MSGNPKLCARIARFEAALALKAMNSSMQWTTIAHGLGYHDQMHMVHDFHHLSGAVPQPSSAYWICSYSQKSSLLLRRSEALLLTQDRAQLRL